MEVSRAAPGGRSGRRCDSSSARSLVVPSAWSRWCVALVAALQLPAAGVAQQSSAPAAPAASVPYRDASLPVDARVRDLLGRMTLEEKFWQLYMTPGDLSDPSHDWSAGAFGLQIPADTDAARAHAAKIDRIQRWFVERTRLGIPIIPFDEALHGLKQPGATAFPQAVGLAATFDTALVGRVARAIATETRTRGIRQILSPVVNLADDARWGRVEETYGEDPFLASAMGVVFVRAFEEAGVVATPKHFVANVGDGGRDSYPVHPSERMLRERHYPPFRAAVDEGGARSVMTAYNSVDGLPATQSPRLLRETLKGRWGFGGFVISDAAATGGATVLHMTEPSTPVAAAHAWEAGLDVVFQSRWEQHRPYLRAVEEGLVAEEVLDSAVARVLRAKIGLGLFEDPYVDPDEAARLNGHRDHLALAEEAAAKSLVLLHDPASTLPLDPGALRTVAVIGPDAVEARLGGYAGPGVEPVAILEALRRRLPDADVRYAPGPGRTLTRYVPIPAERLATPDGEPGLRGEYFTDTGLEGEPAVVRTDPGVDVLWTFNPPARGLARDWYSVRWTGRVTAPPGGVRRIGVEGNDGWRLRIDGEVVAERWRKRSYGTVLVPVDLAAGTTHDVRLEYFETTGNARLKLVWDAGIDDGGPAASAAAAIVAAADAARGADVAVVVAGIEEGEFRDRAFLGLPGRQEEAIRAVAATGTPVVVVIVGGSAVTMPWLDEVDAVLMAWYPGERGGPAVAGALVGDVAPAGRLPLTFPIAEGQLPLRYDHLPTGRGDDYLDLTGHPLFPFGHGLAYTEFEYSGLAIEPAVIPPDGAATVRLRVRNAGERTSDEVVQLYVRDELASVARPVQALKGFRRVRLEPGEERELTFTLGPEELGMWNAELRRTVEPGTFRVTVGASSRDLRLRGELVVR